MSEENTQATEAEVEATPAPAPEAAPAPAAERPKLKTNRGPIKTVFFSLLTFGIYWLYLIHAIAHDMNISCAGDGKKTRGLMLYMLFSALTLGIYALVWNIKVCNRMRDRIQAAGEKSVVSGGKWFAWTVLGSLIGVGSLVALGKQTKGLNKCNELYNQGR